MKLTSKIIITVAFLAILLFGCSTKKDRFLNRTLHATTTKYNVLYNGKVAYNAQKKQLDDNYEDDFWNILPIEPLKIEDKLALPNAPLTKQSNTETSASGGFAKAEEKAVKAIQKHSMNIGGAERNKQIDNAYFLLGKARYYDQRFVPALETFKYIIDKYPKSSFFNPARIWSAKSLIRLGIEDEAIYKLDLLLQNKNLLDAVRHDALTAMAMGYSKQDSIQQVINLLDATLLYKTKNHNQKARNLFILGQLYRQQQKIDSSNHAFDALIAYKKAPYRFKIHAKLERAKNYNKDTDSTETLIKSLKKLARNRDNRPFLDGIYYQLGKIAIVNNNTDEAISYFKKSLRTKQAQVNQKSLAYEEIGNIQFDMANFLNAGSYYDSVLNITKDKNTKRIRRLIRKRKGLDQVIRLENIVHRNDSILDLLAMSKEEQENFFNTYIDKLKKQEEENRIIAENKKNVNSGTSFSNGNVNLNGNGSTFYFYNVQSVGFGQAEFQKIWGNRDLTDNWRLSNTQSANFNEDGEEKETIEDIADTSKKFDLNYYLDKIPTKKTAIDSISTKRNKAYYNLGLIYKEQFKKYELATNRLEKLLSFSPSENMILPTYYHLYKAFKNFDIPKSDYYKNKITTEYAESKYAKIIKNPKAILKDTDKNSPENVYKNTYKLYTEKQYDAVLKNCTQSILKFANMPIVPKFELLKAYTIAKTTNKNDFITALNFVAVNYPNTEEGKHAIRVIASLNGNIEKEKIQVPNKTKNSIPKRKYSPKKKTIKNLGNLPSKDEMFKRIKNNTQKGPPSPKK